MRRMSANNHRGQEVTNLPETGRIYESNDFLSHRESNVLQTEWVHYVGTSREAGMPGATPVRDVGTVAPGVLPSCDTCTSLYVVAGRQGCRERRP